MRIIMVGGSRYYPDKHQVDYVVNRCLKNTDVLIHGNCKDSPDVWADKIARKKGCVVGQFPYVSKLGKAGGHKRNRAMVKMADACLFFWDGVSQGTGKTIEYARTLNKKVYITKPGDSN